MAMLNFNANDVDPSLGFDPVPAGKYLVAITESEFKATKNGSGQYLQLCFEVVEGEFKGRKLWERLSLENANATAAAIARSKLSAICHAIGVMTPNDSVELHGLPLCATVVQKPRTDNGQPANEITKFEKRDVLLGVPQQAPQRAPWKRS